MTHDRQITISVGSSRQSTSWSSQTMLVSALWDKLRYYNRGTETLSEYLLMRKAEQDNLKDVGGFVGGTLNGPRRKAMNVTGRDLITLDLDNIPGAQFDSLLTGIQSLGCNLCVYSTRKHQPAAPRIRVIIPTDRTVTPEEYEPIARKVCERIGLAYADNTTFDVSRLMYWPSCCADSEPVYFASDAPFLCADSVLAMYADWHDVSSWPALPGQQALTKMATKQGNPEAKQGIVGAFCNVYDVRRAMTELLPGIYEEVDTAPDRFTYLGGTTTGGAVLYDSGKFLYSHHSTDPCGGMLVNAFDLVRIHKFADKDEVVQGSVPTNRLPSYTAMCELATSLPEVATYINKQRYDGLVKDFSGLQVTDQSGDWMEQLDLNSKTALPKPTINNILLILENDPLLKGKIAFNSFSNLAEVFGSLPWDKSEKRRIWSDTDKDGLYWYMETVYNITGTGKVGSALAMTLHQHAFNEVQDYLRSVEGKWDGVPRLDTLFVDYLGAEDTRYVRSVTRKMFVAAVARAMLPGCKFDNMLILVGPQGLGKSTLLDKMSRGHFLDSIKSFEGKDASELLPGVWLVEIAELEAFQKSDITRIKQFMSLRVDRFRAAYAENKTENPRSCVFFGTSNKYEVLTDTTGNRRFWPVDVGKQPPKKDLWHQLDSELDQLWAEAYTRFAIGESLYLEDEVVAEANASQETHRESSVREGIIRDFINRPVPLDWQSWSLNKRLMYWGGGMTEDIPCGPRDCVCALEIWCEALGGDIKNIKRTDALEINAVLDATLGWERSGAKRCGVYGVQKTHRKL